MKLVQAVALMAKASRREASELIKAGEVTVNGKIAESFGQIVNPNADQIKIKKQKTNKRLLTIKKYFMFYKPRGMVSTLANKSNTIKKVVDEIHIPNLKPVGRLDAESEGLMILTNDGDLINKLTHPSSHVEKTYLVTASGFKDNDQLEHLKKLLKLKLISSLDGRLIFEVVLLEGKNRQIRRACAQTGLFVERILRITIGNVKLSSSQSKPKAKFNNRQNIKSDFRSILKPGEWKELEINPFK